jgi:plastocyanin
VALLIVATAALASAASAAANTVTVTVGPAGSLTFSPADATIHVGDTVHWVWDSSNHSTTSGSPPGTADGQWDSHVQNKPFSFDQTFNTPGTFHYFCSLHYAFGMVGSITVSNGDELPTASFSFSPSAPAAGQAVAFDGSGSIDPDGSITSYSWDFGDGSAAGSGAAPHHVYAAPGSFSAKLTVTDSSGLTSTQTRTVRVGEAGTIARVSLRKSKHRTVLVAALTGPGTLSFHLFKRSHRIAVSHAEKLRVPIALPASARRSLHKHGKLKVRLSLRYAPTIGSSTLKTITLLFRPSSVKLLSG